jgi:hypothetical protein
MKKLLGCVVIALALTACGDVGVGDRVGESILPPGEVVLAQGQVSWAEGSQIHDGDQVFDLSPLHVTEYRRTQYGFLVRLADSPRDGAERSWQFYDGADLVELPGEVRTPEVSPDGRYAGWIDFEGPLREAGRVAKVVVVDLESGLVVFTTSDGMGGEDGDDLGDRYEELQPTFIGFDEEWAYWYDASGHGLRTRWNLSTGEVQPAETDMEAEGGIGWIGFPGDAYRGWSAPVEGGRITTPDDPSWTPGRVSPGRDYVVDTSLTGKVAFTDATTGRRIPIDVGHKFAFFGGWLDDHGFYGLAMEQFAFSFDPDEPDRTRGVIVVCDLAAATCRDREETIGTRALTFPTGEGLSSY